MARAVPVLLYHSVSPTPSKAIRGFALSPAGFGRQLDAIIESGATCFDVTGYLAARDANALPAHSVVITFDDGFADFYDHALPALQERALPSTLYVTTGFLEGRPEHTVDRRPPDKMLSWTALHDLRAAGVEIGAHSHSHFYLDTLNRRTLHDEVTVCKDLLEAELGSPVPSFAYPNGYCGPRAVAMVRGAGYASACAVRNVLSPTDDNRFALARLTIRSSTDIDTFRAWLSGDGARVARASESYTTRAYRVYRRGRAIIAHQPGSDFRRLMSG
jgi:peptidoglycan/xylan/chitin deacetylase (PgdA/CDA1 family)